MDPLPCTVAWRRVLDEKSFELMSLSGAEDGYQFHGIVLAVEDGKPLHVAYRIVCDPDWRTRAAVVEQTWGRDAKRRMLEHRDGVWLVDGSHVPELDGCSDIDLGISPSTNTIAINRLNLAVGSVAEICAAWVKFPSLAVERGLQSYERLADRRFVYRSLGSGFKAIVDVDDTGLVVTYERSWQRIAAAVGDTLANELSPASDIPAGGMVPRR